MLRSLAPAMAAVVSGSARRVSAHSRCLLARIRLITTPCLGSFSHPRPPKLQYNLALVVLGHRAHQLAPQDAGRIAGHKIWLGDRDDSRLCPGSARETHLPVGLSGILPCTTTSVYARTM